ncbi:class 1 isoprenoid biosynthesis enzyme [Streptomyces sp900105245]|uniref:class 1 isoprenoid biosynthesis enzyme n=1 Tax=Streptomyces sp. 900105245 TaxID=3154379 RepID=UPI00332744E6
MNDPEPFPAPPAAPAPPSPIGRCRVLFEALRVPGQAVRLLPTLPAVNADCRTLAAAHASAVAPLLPGGADGALGRRLLPWAVKGGLLVLRYARLTGHPVDPATAVLAGAFTRLYDDAFDEARGGEGLAVLDRLVAEPTTPAPQAPGTPAESAAVLFAALRERLPADRHPVSYGALSQLHAAQHASLRPPGDRRPSAPELVRASRHKGGLGMLVLGGLVQPAPAPAQRKALLALGGFLQLVDDYEDLAVDLRAGLRTAATCGNLPLGALYAELSHVEALLAALYGPYRTRRFTDGLVCWLHLAAVTRLVRGRTPPSSAGPAAAGPPTVTALFTRREVIR